MADTNETTSSQSSVINFLNLDVGLGMAANVFSYTLASAGITALSSMTMSPMFRQGIPTEMDISMIASTSKTDDNNGLVMAKEEPASSDSQPGTPREADSRKVPACAICGADSTGIHFGVDACAACSAFFRRTVVLNKEYGCNKNGACVVVKDGSAGQKCRSCRFAKCLQVGMDKNSVQHRRDAIGKYSTGVKREYSPGEFKASNSPQFAPSPKQLRPAGSGGGGVLDELLERHDCLIRNRKLFYATNMCNEVFGDDELGIQEMSDYKECMYQVWKVEPRLAAEYVASNRFLRSISPRERNKLYRNFVIQRQAIEEPYMTWKFGGLEKNWWIMTNRTYIDIEQAEKYWTNGTIKNINLNYNDAKNLFESSFQAAMTTIGKQMRDLRISETEMVALCGISLLDPTVATLEMESKQVIWALRDQLIKEIMAFYEDEEGEPELRLANLLMLLAAVKVHAIKTSENMHLLHTFQLIANDSLFNDICRGNIYDADNSPQV